MGKPEDTETSAMRAFLERLKNEQPKAYETSGNRVPDSKSQPTVAPK